jgi:hypothetical protein
MDTILNPAYVHIPPTNSVFTDVPLGRIRVLREDEYPKMGTLAEYKKSAFLESVILSRLYCLLK